MTGRVEGNVECTFMKANRNAMMKWISRESDSGGAGPETERNEQEPSGGRPTEFQNVAAGGPLKSIFNRQRARVFFSSLLLYLQ